MNCYVCNKQGKEKSAVAICIVCGMALCEEHLVREELPVWKDIQLGIGSNRVKLPETLPRIVCAQCHAALKQNN